MKSPVLPAWLFALVILIATVALGAWMIHKGHLGVPEGLSMSFQREGFFDTASQSANRACEVAYQACLNDGQTFETCQLAYDNCRRGIVNPSVSSATPAPSSPGSAGTSAAAPASRDISGSSGYSTASVSDDYNALRQLALTGQSATLTPGLQTFLKQVQTKASQIYPDPTADQLGAAQGGEQQPPYVAYKPSQQIIQPHQTPQAQPGQITANAPTDRGTGAEQIMVGGVLAPSVRSQIRDDVRAAVGQELQRLQSEYEISYE